MEITEVFYPTTRAQWRQWLKTHHLTKPHIWVQRFNKSSNIVSISYDELVEEALCFGWIDATVKKYTHDSSVQRIGPRRKKSFLSELNRQRIWKLEFSKQITAPMKNQAYACISTQISSPKTPIPIAKWIIKKLQKDPFVWTTFCSYSLLYRRLKLGWITDIDDSRKEEQEKRLAHLITMTAQNKQYGTRPFSEAQEKIFLKAYKNTPAYHVV